MKPRNYVLFVFDLDDECKFIKNKTLQGLIIKEICSLLPPFCIQNLLFTQPRWHIFCINAIDNLCQHSTGPFVEGQNDVQSLVITKIVDISLSRHSQIPYQDQ